MVSSSPAQSLNSSGHVQIMHDPEKKKKKHSQVNYINIRLIVACIYIYSDINIYKLLHILIQGHYIILIFILRYKIHSCNIYFITIANGCPPPHFWHRSVAEALGSISQHRTVWEGGKCSPWLQRYTMVYPFWNHDDIK